MSNAPPALCNPSLPHRIKKQPWEEQWVCLCDRHCVRWRGVAASPPTVRDARCWYSLVMPSVMMSVILQQEDSMRMLSWSTTSTWGQQPSGRDGAAGNHPTCSHSFPSLSFQPSFSCSLAHLPFSLLLHFPDHIVHNFCKRKRWVGLSTLSPPAAPWDAPFPGDVWWGCFGGRGGGGSPPAHTHGTQGLRGEH